MKIDETPRIGALRVYSQMAERRAEGAVGKKRKDEVHISAEAKQLLDARELQEAERSRRLEALKREVASGTYYVEAGKIAEKLLPFLLK